MNIRTLVACAGLAVAAASQAIVIPITTLKGTGDSGALAGGAFDPHYTIISGPITGDTRVVHPGFFPLNGPWVPNAPNAKWIAPASTVPTNPGSAASAPTGTYVFRHTFDLSDYFHNTASITGKWSSDNNGIGVFLNGVLIPGSANNSLTAYKNFKSFSANSGFVAGLNTLDFHVFNENRLTGNPTGLIVKVQGSAEPIPEPATMTALALGAAFLANRRRKTA